MTDMDLLDFMVRQYQTQSKLAESLKLGDSAISSWRKTGQLPKAWKMYFMAQFEKSGEANEKLVKQANDMMNANAIGQAAMRNAGSLYNKMPGHYERAAFKNEI